jgi:acetyltransferase-like isoleucine patch superfamily enzyme
MHMPWLNPDNPEVEQSHVLVSKQRTPLQSALLTLLIVVLFPVMLVLYPVGMLLWGAFKMTGVVAFYLLNVFVGKPNKQPRYRFQCVRSWLSQQAASLPHINTGFRMFLYRLSGIKIGKNSFVGMQGILEDLHPENVVIEDSVSISFGVTIVGHGPGTPGNKPTIFRTHSYVGARATILPGVEIGKYALVGAGAVVTKDVPPGAVVVGCPARIIRYRNGYGPKKD